MLGFRSGSHQAVILSGAVEVVNRTGTTIINFQRGSNYKGPITLLNVETGERR